MGARLIVPGVWDGCGTQVPRGTLDGLMRRCVEWGSDCWSIDPDRETLHRSSDGPWEKIACTALRLGSTERSPSGLEGCLLARRWMTDRSMVDGDVAATNDTLSHMRFLSTEIACP